MLPEIHSYVASRAFNELKDLPNMVNMLPINSFSSVVWGLDEYMTELKEYGLRAAQAFE